MSNVKFPICQNGFQYKTINIRTIAGGLKFNLQQVNELGLPYDCQILALWVRDSEKDRTSSNNIELVGAAVQNNSFISLKDKASATGKIDLVLSEHWIPDLKIVQFFQPIMSANIDWNQSFIQLNPSTGANDNQVFEIVVIYSTPGSEPEFPNRLKLRTGQEFTGCRLANFEVPLNITQTVYSLSNSDNIGIPQDALILGFKCFNDREPLFGGSSMPSLNFNSSYLTLKQGTCAFVDEFPIELSIAPNRHFLGSAYNYVPIVPTQVLAIDWQQSKLVIMDNAGMVAGNTFQFGLWWWSPNC
jgi:hypothetical protein|tara:strand:+ start:6292 stop:7194 length:903 start_codon:yes stop_codon:yes gene_type:complete